MYIFSVGVGESAMSREGYGRFDSLPSHLSSAFLTEGVNLADGLSLTSITVCAEAFLARDLISLNLLSPRAHAGLL